ncbi:MAG: hypothetical protein C4346_02105 [Chloroflexota bacterium]
MLRFSWSRERGRAERSLLVPASDRRRQSAPIIGHPEPREGSLTERSGLSDLPSGWADAEANGWRSDARRLVADG